MQTVPGIAALVPRRLWSNDYSPGVRSCRGTILFADIAGFTRLTETARRRGGTRGIELLTTQINAIFGDLVAAAHNSGGDVLKFGGDAILVAYDSPGSESVSYAIDGACAMERAMAKHRRSTLRALSLHLGLAHGEWNEIVTGTPGSRREHFVWGNAISQAMQAADASGSSPWIYCQKSSLPADRGQSRFTQLAQGLFEFVPTRKRLRESPVTAASEPEDTSLLWDFVAERLRDDPRISTFGSGQSAEHRFVSTLFGFWTCPQSLRDPARAARLYEQVFHTARKTEQSFDGLWARSDPSGDKQKLLMLFGATQSRPDDTDRAIAAARALRQEFQGLKCEHPSLRLGIGVATTTVFAGFVGHTDRREFTAMGDGVNLAARLAAKSKRGKILVDDRTRGESTRFQFQGAGELTLKNVRKPTPVFVPVAELDATSTPVRGDILEHPQALAECMRRLESGSRLVWLNALPGTDARKFTAQLLSRMDFPEGARLAITFDTSNMSHPLGGIRRLITVLFTRSHATFPTKDLGALNEMLDDTGLWAARALKRLGLDAAARSVAREIARQRLPELFVVLDHVEVLGEFERRVLTELVTQNGPRWMVIAHAEKESTNWLSPETPIELGPLSRTEFTGVIGDLLGPSRVSKPLMEFVFARSQGFPRLASTLATHLISQGAAVLMKGRHPIWHLRSSENLDLPNGLRSEYLQHVDRLPSRDQHLLRSIAVLGDTSPLKAVECLCEDISASELRESLTRLQNVGLVSVTEVGTERLVAIDDSTCRQAVYETMSHTLREKWHEMAAAFWMKVPVRDSARIGEHLFRARNPESSKWLTHAAGQARRFWSLNRAVRLTRWAILAHQRRCDPDYATVCPPITGELSRKLEQLYSGLAEILTLQGRHFESARIQKWLAQHASRRGNKRLACHYSLASARMELFAGHYRRSLSQIRHVQKISRLLKDDRIKAESSYLLGETFRRSGRIERSLQALETAESLASRGSNRSMYADILNALGLLHWNCGRLNEARKCFEYSLRQLPRQTDHARRGQVSNNLGILTEEQGRLRVAEQYYHKAFTLFDSSGVRRHRAYSLGNLANLHRHSARYERAREAYEEVETELMAMGEAHAAAYTVGNIGDLERDFGDFDSARQRYEATLDFARKSGDEELKSECYSRLARLHLLTGRLDMMPRVLTLARKAATLAKSQEFALYAQLMMAECDLAKLNIESAKCHALSASESAKDVGLVYYQLWTEAVRTRIELSEGNNVHASRRCARAMAKAHSSGYRWWELQLAVLGATEIMPSGVRDRSIRRCALITGGIEAGIGDPEVRSRFSRLAIVREANAFAEAAPRDHEDQS